MLKIKNLSLSYQDHRVIDKFNLELLKGEVCLITGASGSGKSSLIKILNGIIPEIIEAKVNGEISLNGQDLNAMSIARRSYHISTVFQNPKTQFYCVDSTDEIAFPLENRNLEKELIFSTIAKCTKLLKTESLLNKNIFSLSGGEKQLMAITSVLTMDNEVYLFDEPSSSLDLQAIRLLKKAIIELKKAGKIVLIAEHRLYYLLDIIDKLVIIDDKVSKCFMARKLSSMTLLKLQNEYLLRSLYAIDKSTLKKHHPYYQIQLLKKATNSYSTKPMLRCEDYQQSYNAKKILDFKQISFNRGIYFIIGNNGVGKSTFIKKMARLLKGKGKTYWDNQVIKKAYNYISMVMQDVNYQIFTESVWSEISIVSDDEDKKIQVLKELKLLDKKDKHPQALSGGEKQRLMLALAIVSPKPIVILDEPTSGLCKQQLLSIVKYLKLMQKEGKLVIVITHDYELIRECGGTIYEFIDA